MIEPVSGSAEKLRFCLALLTKLILFHAFLFPGTGWAADPAVSREFSTGLQLDSTLSQEQFVCSENELVLANGFEPTPDQQIEFVGGGSFLIQAEGEVVNLNVSFRDSRGQALDGSRLEWCLEDSSNLRITPNGSSATITATRFEISSVDVIVRDPVTQMIARGVVVMAELMPNVELVTVTGFISGVTPALGESGVVRLARNALTETFDVGTVITSGPDVGLLVRVLKVARYASYIEFEVEAATLKDVYARIDLDTESVVVSFSGGLEEESTIESSQVSSGPGRKPKSIFTEPPECEGSVATIALKSPTFALELEVNQRIVIKRTEDDEFERLGVVVTADAGLSGNLGKDIEVRPGLKYRCKGQLGVIQTVPVWIPSTPIVVGWALEPEIGFEVELSKNSTSVSLLKPPEIEAEANMQVGFLWQKDTGLDWIGDTSFSYDPVSISSPPDQEAYTLALKPFSTLGLSLAVWRVPAFSMSEIEFGTPLAMQWQGVEFDHRKREYFGPSWNLDLLLDATWGGGVGDALNKLYEDVFGVIGVSVDTAQPLFSIAWRMLESPEPVLDLSCEPSSCFLDPANQEFLELTLRTEQLFWRNRARWPQDSRPLPTVDFVAWRNEEEYSVDLAPENWFVKGATDEVTWQPEMDDLGEWQVAALLWNIDPISDQFPYIIRTTRPVEVNPTVEVTVVKQNPLGDTIQDGVVTTLSGGIDCGLICSNAFPVGNSLTLQAGDTENWAFQKWSPESQVCPGSESATCLIDPLESGKSVIAQFMIPDPIIESHFTGQWDVYQDIWYYAGEAGDVPANSCYQLSSEVVNGIDLVMHTIQAPVFEVALHANGSSSETQNNLLGESGGCTVTDSDVLEDPGNWHVSEGVFSYNAVFDYRSFSGFVTALKESYDEYTFFVHDPGNPLHYGYRYRLVRK